MTTTLPTATLSTFDELAAQRPRDLDEAILCMQRALGYFHEKRDKRAVFLRLYYRMTLEVYRAVHGLDPYAGKRIFLDPAWIVRLSGIFSSLYFESLTTAKRAPDVARAWEIAHDTAESGRGTVTQDALLGIVAHIMYDLPRAIAKNLAEHGDLADVLVTRDQPNRIGDLLDSGDGIHLSAAGYRALARAVDPGKLTKPACS